MSTKRVQFFSFIKILVHLKPIKPYRQYNGPPKIPASVTIEGDPLLRIWLGRKDNSLWDKCVDACEAFFRANDAAGTPYALVQPTGTTEADYRRAFRSA